jgi:hypothetical protein
MKVLSYTATLPSKMMHRSDYTSNAKWITLNKFIEGVNACGDRGIVWSEMSYQPSEVAVMLGWVHENGKTAPHLRFRQTILDQQRKKSNRVVIADSNLFLYKDLANPLNYLRYSFDGVFPNTGEYCDSRPTSHRWEKISKDLELKLRGWRANGDHILLCLQRNGGWSMGPLAVPNWAFDNICTLRKYTDRPIKIRVHPGDRSARSYAYNIMNSVNKHGIQNITVSNFDLPFIKDLKNAWAVVNHNSSPAVGAAIEGIPVFVTDPEKSPAKDIANTDLRLIESPKLMDREPWVHRLAQFHWSWDDLTSGACWQHMRQWVK